MGERKSDPNPIETVTIPCRRCHYRVPFGVPCPRCSDKEAAEEGLISALLRWLRATTEYSRQDEF
jgi:hypothetical protein